MQGESIADRRQRELDKMARINGRKLKAHIATHPQLKTARKCIQAQTR